MLTQVLINNITGQPPYDVYICQPDGTGCIYISRINSSPYLFEIPAPYDIYDSYMLKIIDGNNCVISGVENVEECVITPTPAPTATPTVTPTVTPTNTITPTPTPTPTNTITPTETPTPTPTPTTTCQCYTYSIEFSEDYNEFVDFTDCNNGSPMSESGLYFGLPQDSFLSGSIIYVCSCSEPVVNTPNAVVTQLFVGCNTGDGCDCVRVRFTGTSGEFTYNVRFTDCDGIEQNVTIGSSDEEFCVSANTAIDSAGRSFYYDGCCDCGEDIPCEQWGVYANSGTITFDYIGCDGTPGSVILDGISLGSAFVCIQPGSESYITTGDATAVKIGCCCECESYRITGDTTYGTTVYDVKYCGTSTTIPQIDLTPGEIITICIESIGLVSVNNPTIDFIPPMIESLGCCNTEPIP